jgi:hypothetical protein
MSADDRIESLICSVVIIVLILKEFEICPAETCRAFVLITLRPAVRRTVPR